MKMKGYILAAILVMFSGCATVTGYQPTLNEKADKNVATIQSDLEYCKGLAMESAGFVKDGTTSTLTGAGFAAAEGSVFGALTGFWGAGIGAAVGAPVGAIAGLWYSEYDANLIYKQSYKNCLFQLGHKPV